MDTSEATLTKDKENAMVAGVCAGLAHHFGIDVSLVRAAFVASVVLGGFGPAAYVALWVLLDDAPAIVPPCAVGGGEDVEQSEVDIATAGDPEIDGPEVHMADEVVADEVVDLSQNPVRPDPRTESLR